MEYDTRMLPDEFLTFVTFKPTSSPTSLTWVPPQGHSSPAIFTTRVPSCSVTCTAPPSVTNRSMCDCTELISASFSTALDMLIFFPVPTTYSTYAPDGKWYPLPGVHPKSPTAVTAASSRWPLECSRAYSFLFCSSTRHKTWEPTQSCQAYAMMCKN